MTLDKASDGWLFKLKSIRFDEKVTEMQSIFRHFFYSIKAAVFTDIQPMIIFLITSKYPAAAR